MTSRRQKHRTNSPSTVRGASPATAPHDQPNAPSKRKRSFRIVAALLLPLAILGFGEVVLRVSGYGYPTGFFIAFNADGQRHYVENQKFGWRFFDPGLARSPRPVVLPAEKERGTFRIFVLGESAAYGDPQPDFGLPRMLEVLLRERYPGVRFEVINAAMTAVNSHVALPIARDCVERDGDLWVIYLGNNEVVGPFGSGTVFGARAPPLPVIRGGVALKATRTGQLIADMARRMRAAPDARPEWGGMMMFLENKIRHDDPRMSRTYAQFEQNLQDILRFAVNRRVKAVVSTVACNLKDCAPFASVHRPGLTAAEADEWNRCYEAACRNPDASSALELFGKAARIDEGFADLQYMWGNGCYRLGRLDEARRHFAMARDYDALRFRADSRINDIIRQVAAGRQQEGVVFCDSQQMVAERSPDGLPGSNLFYEHVHLNFDGNYVLALGIANEVAKLLPEDVRRRGNAQGSWPSAAECARQLGWTDWNRYEGVAAMMLRLNDPPFTLQRGHAAQVQSLRREMERLAAALSPDALARYAGEYRSILGATTNDWVLYRNYARLLQRAGDIAGAVESWGRVVRLLPHDPEARTSLGLLLIRAGKPAEAIPQFEIALSLSRNSIAARNGYGLALAALNRYPDAVRQYERALRVSPDSSETRLNLATALKALGKQGDASEHLRRALDHKPNNAEALVQLGKMCLGQGWVPEAITNFSGALALEPTDANAHFCLGGAMEMLRRWPEARDHYAEAVRLRPGFAEARVGLGTELGREGKHGQALEQFTEAVRLNPQLIEARLNLGIALARVSRFDEAISQFEEVLRIKPDNAVALKNLQQLRAQSRGKP